MTTLLMKDAIFKKVRESRETSTRFFEENADRLVACARDVAMRFQRGGRLFTLGNGGSSCDAEHVAVEFVHPIVEKRRALPAMSLATNVATMSAMANDIDFSMVFDRQLDVLARPEDMVLGVSTSGASANVVRALKRSRERGLLTIGFSGRDGGKMPHVCDHSFVVKTWSVHRVQEAHTILLHVLWDLVHVTMGEDDVL